VSDTFQIEEINKKVSLAKNLTWLAGALLAAVVGVSAWTIAQLQEMTNGFVSYSDELRVFVEDPNGTEFDLNVRTDVPAGNELRVDAGPALFLPYFRATSEDQSEVAFRIEKK